jgi:hypothetical protein
MSSRRPFRRTGTGKAGADARDCLPNDAPGAQQNAGHRRLLAPSFETPFDNLFKKGNSVAQVSEKPRRSASVQRAPAPQMVDPVRRPRETDARPVRLAPSIALTVETPYIRTGGAELRPRPPKRDPLKPARGKSDIPPAPAKSDPLAQTQTQRPRVSFDFGNCPKSERTEWLSDPPGLKTEKPFREPTDFSKVCHFPSRWLFSKAQEDTQPEKSRTLRLESSEQLNKIAPLDEFLKIESEIKEANDANDRTVLNYHKMLRIVKEYVNDNETERKDIVRKMTKHRNEHFVLLLARPHLHLIAVYLLKADLSRIDKLWGPGPAIVRPTDADACWHYNILTKEFVASQQRAFQTNLDAVTL